MHKLFFEPYVAQNLVSISELKQRFDDLGLNPEKT